MGSQGQLPQEPDADRPALPPRRSALPHHLLTRRLRRLPRALRHRLAQRRAGSASPAPALAATLATALAALGLVTLAACAPTSTAAQAASAPTPSALSASSAPAGAPSTTRPATTAQATASAPGIIDAAAVQAAIDRGAIVWDVRPTRDYEAGHIPGAVSIGNIHQVLRDPNREDWIATDEIARILGAAGIDVLGREVVVYGTASDSGAYYAMNGMRHFGAPHISVYHGGYDDWVEGKRHISREPDRLAPVTLALAPVGGVLLDNAAMIARVREGHSQIIDARTVGEFTGDDIRAIRGGHVPGAINIPYENNWVDPLTAIKLSRREAKNRDGMSLRPETDLRALYAGLDPDKEVVVYCQSGVRASVTAVVLRDLGFRDVKVYEPSWLGYAGTLSAPVDNEVFLNVGALNNRIGALQGRVSELEAELARVKEAGGKPR